MISNAPPVFITGVKYLSQQAKYGLTPALKFPCILHYPYDRLEALPTSLRNIYMREPFVATLSILSTRLLFRYRHKIMCRQILQVAKCGHENGTKTTKCEKPTSECGGIFLKPVLEDVKGLCAVRKHL